MCLSESQLVFLYQSLSELAPLSVSRQQNLPDTRHPAQCLTPSCLINESRKATPEVTAIDLLKASPGQHFLRSLPKSPNMAIFRSLWLTPTDANNQGETSKERQREG